MPTFRARSTRRALLVSLAIGVVSSSLSGVAVATTDGADSPDAIRMNYVVNTARGAAAIAAGRAAIEAEGGVVLASYQPIGVLVAQSATDGFEAALRLHTDAVQSVGATRTAAATEPNRGQFDGEQRVLTDPDPRESEQWGNTQTQSLAANDIQPGDPDVIVGVLDSGVDDTHPDLSANFDASRSVSCENNGIPDQTDGAWRPTSSTHGTHVAGTIAADRNGIGTAGMAPDITYASIKVVDDGGFIYPEYALCGFMWAARHGISVTNNSYFIDPWEFWCADDAEQGPVQVAIRKLIRFTQARKDMVNVAAAGNSSYDLANKTTDNNSPDDGQAIPRVINAGCLDIPTELPGVLTVSATTQAGAKASYSNYGAGKIDIAGPGSSILSTTWPGHGYGLLSGTSMASPHVAGIAALVRSQFPHKSSTQVRHILKVSASDRACPVTEPMCTGTPANNSYFGQGLVNALNAVS